MNLVKAMAAVGGMTALSRIAGYVRDMMMAAYMGVGPISDAFVVALRLPNFFRSVTAEGAFSVSFLPIYSQKLTTETQKNADIFASNAFMIMLSVLSAVTILAIMFMPYILMVIAPGFSEKPSAEFAVEFSRITFPYLLLMSLCALLGGVLNALDRFGQFAFAPILFNLCLIAALLLSGHFETVGHALSWGVLISGFLQLAFLWGCARRAKVKITFARPRIDEDTRRVFKLMVPAMIGASVMHINLFVDMIIASNLSEGAISYLYYADRLNQIPLGIVGVAVGTALLPMLSRAMAKTDTSEATHLFNRALEYCMLLALPAAIALMVMPHTLIKVLFERGEFSAVDSAETAKVLACYAIGLPAYIAGKVFSTAHWARQDTTTPVRISIGVTLLNIVLCLSFVPFLGVTGIALGTGLVAWVQYFAHIYFLKGHPSARFDDKFRYTMPRIIASSCAMGLVVFILATLFQGIIFENRGMVKVLMLFVLVFAGAAVYAAAILWSGAVKISDIKRYILKRQ